MSDLPSPCCRRCRRCRRCCSRLQPQLLLPIRRPCSSTSGWGARVQQWLCVLLCVALQGQGDEPAGVYACLPVPEDRVDVHGQGDRHHNRNHRHHVGCPSGADAANTGLHLRAAASKQQICEQKAGTAATETKEDNCQRSMTIVRLGLHDGSELAEKFKDDLGTAKPQLTRRADACMVLEALFSVRDTTCRSGQAGQSENVSK